jgi:hypothetical protein
MKAVGVPERNLKESSHYGSFARTVVSTFIMFFIILKRLVIRGLRSGIPLNC